MKKDIENYVRACETCQRTKSSTQAKAAPLHPNTIPSRPWTHISVDMVTGLPKCNGQDAILMIVDRFSKEIIPIAVRQNFHRKGGPKFYETKFMPNTECHRSVISDRGTVFVSKFMKDLYDLLQIKANASTAYHPQTDGQTERVNQEVEKYLRIFVNHLQNDWVEWLSLAAFAHNNRVHSATGKSPFEVNYGYNAEILPGAKPKAPFRTPASTTFVSEMQKIHGEAKRALEKAADQMKAQYDKKKRPAVEYQIGDKVWLDTTNLSLHDQRKNSPINAQVHFSLSRRKEHRLYLETPFKLENTSHI